MELAPFSPTGVSTSKLSASGIFDIIQTNGGTLAIGGATDAPAGATTPTVRATAVTIANALNVTGIASTLRLDAIGAINETGGPLTVAKLTGTGGTWTLDNPGNAIGSIGDLTATRFSLHNSVPLTVAGALNGGSSVTIVDGGSLTIAGSIAALSVDLKAASIAETGALTAGTLTINTSGAASLTGTNQIATLGNVNASSFALNDVTDLLIAGTLNATNIAIRAPGNQISLGNGATIITGGTTRPPGAIQSALEPSNGGPGAFFQAANFVQIDTSNVFGQGGGPATLQVSVTGNMQFDPPLGLIADTTWLILDLTRGTAAGNVFVAALDVSYKTPGSTNLFGTIGGIGGGPAAAAGFIRPAIDSHYLFNNCVIGAAVCQPLPPNSLTSTLGGLNTFLPGTPQPVAALPRAVPVSFVMLPTPDGELTEPDVVPPNISYLDY